MTEIRRKLSIAFFAVLAVISLGSCRQEGPAERAGEKLDKKVEEFGEAMEKKGPAERAGEKLDNAIDDTQKAFEEAGEKAEKTIK